MSTTKRQISVRNKQYTNIKFAYQREERIKISSAKEIDYRVVGGVALGVVGRKVFFSERNDFYYY